MSLVVGGSRSRVLAELRAYVGRYSTWVSALGWGTSGRLPALSVCLSVACQVTFASKRGGAVTRTAHTRDQIGLRPDSSAGGNPAPAAPHPDTLPTTPTRQTAIPAHAVDNFTGCRLTCQPPSPKSQAAPKVHPVQFIRDSPSQVYSMAMGATMHAVGGLVRAA